MCICEKDTKTWKDFYPLGYKKHIHYNKIINYHYEAHDGAGGYTCDYQTIDADEPMYLRVNYPCLYETNRGSYMKRLYHCPLCGRYFPPQSQWEKMEEAQERKRKM